jgi:hypothetical protein
VLLLEGKDEDIPVAVAVTVFQGGVGHTTEATAEVPKLLHRLLAMEFAATERQYGAP